MLSRFVAMCRSHDGAGDDGFISFFFVATCESVKVKLILPQVGKEMK